MSDIKTLIEKMEDANEGSEELDREIHEALGWEYVPPSKLGLKRYKERWVKDDVMSLLVPRYTTSVDDALTTFLEDWGWMYTLAQPGYVGGAHTAKARADIHHKISSGGNYETGLASTMPLAICAASLKAKVKNDT